jgi:hypothetical protein
MKTNRTSLPSAARLSVVAATVLLAASAQAQVPWPERFQGPPQPMPQPMAQPMPQSMAQPVPQSMAPPMAQPSPPVAPPVVHRAVRPVVRKVERPVPRPVLAEPEEPSFSWDPLRFGVAGEVRTIWPQDAAARRLVGKSAPIGGGVSLSYDALRRASKLVAKVDLGWTLTSSTAIRSSFSSQDSESLRTHVLALGVSLRYHIFRWLAPYARVAGGLGWDELSVEGTTASMHDEHMFGHGSVGGGVFLRSPGLYLRSSPPSWSLALVANIEGGYMLASSSTFALQSSPASGVANPVPTASVPIGEMGRNAPYLRAAVGLAF